MDGMLSQEEINALLSGMDLSGSMDLAEEEEKPLNDFSVGGSVSGSDALLSDVEKDAIGEVANISMGSSATTLYSLVNRKVNITTPVVALAEWKNLLEEYGPFKLKKQVKYGTVKVWIYRRCDE